MRRRKQTNKQTWLPRFRLKKKKRRIGGRGEDAEIQGEALVGIYFRRLSAPVCKLISQNSIKQQVSKMANLRLLFPGTALSWLRLLTNHFRTACGIKQRFWTCLQLLKRQEQQPMVCGVWCGEAGAGRCPGPTSSQALTISRLSAESGTSCTAMVSDSHTRTSCTLSPPGPWATAEHPQKPTAKQQKIQTQAQKGSRHWVATLHMGWQGRSRRCWQEGVGILLREREEKKRKNGKLQVFKGESCLASLSRASTETTSNANIKAEMLHWHLSLGSNSSFNWQLK